MMARSGLKLPEHWAFHGQLHEYRRHKKRPYQTIPAYATATAPAPICGSRSLQVRGGGTLARRGLTTDEFLALQDITDIAVKSAAQRASM